MSKKQKKKKPERIADTNGAETEAPPLSELEVELSLICLKYFRGDWDMYLDYLQGPRVTDSQRRREIPLVDPSFLWFAPMCTALIRVRRC